MKYAAYLVATLGILMHGYLAFLQSAAGSIYDIVVPAMNVIPYLACMLLTRSSVRPAMPLCAGIIVLLLDVYLFHGYFFSTKTNRFLVVEICLIILKTVVIVPAGCLIGLFVDGLMKRPAEKK
jgi:hypothetical protein